MSIANILIVEDDSSWLNIYKHELRSYNFNILVAQDCDNALEIILKNEKIEFAIIDLELRNQENQGNLDGVLLLDYLAAKKILTVIVTGNYFENLIEVIEKQFPFVTTYDKCDFKIDDFLNNT